MHRFPGKLVYPSDSGIIQINHGASYGLILARHGEYEMLLRKMANDQ